MEIRSISYTGGVVDIGRVQKNGQLEEVVSLPSAKDEPRAAFKNALSNLAGDFSYFLELAGFKGAVVVHGLKIGKTKDGGQTFRILGGLKVGAGFSSLNTPLLYAPKAGGEGGEATLTADQMGRISKLVTAARKYLEGDRVQTNLNLDDAKDGAAEEQKEGAPA